MLEPKQKVSRSLAYRPDIDGLRAVAVTMVVANHAGWSGFAGGFAGVDVFFAISGFLITSLLLHEQQSEGRIALAAFYARRIRRILPPLALMLIAAAIAGFFLLTPVGEQQSLAQSTLAATGFVSNLYFLQASTGYFAPAAQFMVLLHTWSLGIEEQFYLAWPLVVIGATSLAGRWRTSPARLLIPLVVIGGAVSLAACLLVMRRSETAAFYFTPFRAWEIAIGALLALWGPLRPARLLGATFGVTGLAAIVAVTIIQTPGTGFALAALIATLGTVAIIAAGALSTSGPVTRLLSTRPLVEIGKLSYSWYLWHWPLLSLGRLRALGEPSAVRDTVLVLAALGLAALTRLLVERPSTGRWTSAFSPPRRAFRTGALLSAICVLLASVLWLWGDARRSSTPLLAAVDQAVRHRIVFEPECDGTADQQTSLLPPHCSVGSTTGPTVLLWGDSHARHLMPGLARAGQTGGITVVPQYKSGCRPGLTAGRYAKGLEHRREDRCRTFNTAVMKEIPKLRAERGVQGVIISSRWSREDGWETDLGALLQRLHSLGLRVVIVADPPSYPYDIPACLARRELQHCVAERGEMANAQAADTAALRRIAATVPGVRVWDPAQVLCQRGQCDLIASGKVLYSDWHHLSPAGSLYLGQFLAEPLQWAAGGKDMTDRGSQPEH